MRRVLFLAWLTLQEVGRRRLLWIGLALGAVYLAVYAWGFRAAFGECLGERPRSEEMARAMALGLAMAGLYGVNFLVVMLSVLASVDTLSGEIASGSIQTIVAKPLRRWEVVLGKWLAFFLLVLSLVAALGGGVLGITWGWSGYWPHNVPEGLALLVLEGAVLISLSLAGGARLSTLSNGVLIFMLFGVAFLGSWVEQFGALMHNESAVQIGILTSLILPTEALWRRASYLMQPPDTTFAASPFGALSVPSSAMVVYALLYGAAALALAFRAFNGRDL
jgi:ABC-type transport system involved in multi-copper enzyme maturation permease subunit